MKIPAKVWSQLGEIPVSQERGLLDPKDIDKEGEFGQWNAMTRSIRIAMDAHPSAKLQTLFHEMVHLALWDAGVTLTPEAEEAVCDAVGVYLAGATLAGFVTLRSAK